MTCRCGSRANGFKDRYSYSPAALDRPVPIIVLGLFTIVAAWDAFVAQFLPKECADELPTVYDVAIMTGGLLPWYWWVIVGLTLLLGIVFEYSFRQRHSRRHTISTQAQFFWQAEERWLNVPGVGREAARLIMMAPTFDDARAVHDTFLGRASENRALVGALRHPVQDGNGWPRRRGYRESS